VPLLTYRFVLARVKQQRREDLVPSLRISGAIPLFSSHTFLTLTRTTVSEGKVTCCFGAPATVHLFTIHYVCRVIKTRSGRCGKQPPDNSPLFASIADCHIIYKGHNATESVAPESVVVTVYEYTTKYNIQKLHFSPTQC